jgi:hypothetical protein
LIVHEIPVWNLRGESLVNECARLLSNSALRADRIAAEYLEPFKEM